MRELYESLGSLLGDEYSIYTSDGGDSALALLEKTPVDVIVSDLEMPEMNGPDLLTAVERKHPETMRIVISGYTDQLAVAQCLMFGHRYFQKPVQPLALATSLRRVCHLKRVIRGEHLRKIIGGTAILPTPPETYLRLTEAMEQPETSIDDLAGIVQVDPGLTAKLLQVVNSPRFGVSYEVTTASQAMQIVGIEILRALMLGLHAVKFWENKRFKSISLAQVWQHAVDTAVRAKKIAQAEGLDAKKCEECFVAGLLHDIGKMILAGNADADYAAVLERAAKEKIAPVAVEREVFGASHAEIGAYLLGLWGLPESIVAGVELHHSIEKLPPGVFSPALAVHTAQNVVADATRFVDLREETLAQLGCLDHVATWLQALEE